jgi:hypothetical protein
MRINQLQYLFHLYTLETPPLEVIVGIRGDRLSSSENSVQYQSFPTGMASTRYVVSVMKESEVYLELLTVDPTEEILSEIIEDATFRSYTIAQCEELLEKIERDKNTLRADREMYRILQRDPSLKELFPERVLFWQLLELSKGKKVYETKFEAPQECAGDAKRYALHAARIICERTDGIIYDEEQDALGLLIKKEKRRLVCVSVSRSVEAEYNQWKWISYKG